ncbi:MAG TPA: MoaD/ThiS family protein [Thermoplasmata archaeon]|nr:MoaD/ThiS family protein [Thermoplasmata archaeon]
MSDRVTVVFFATARLAAGTGRLSVPVDPTGVPARSLVRSLGERFPKLIPVMRSSRFVLNGRYLNGLGHIVRPGDEFAVHPPYGGG